MDAIFDVLLIVLKIILTPFLALWPPLCVVFFLPILLIRYIIGKSVTYWSSEFGKILTPLSTFLGVDDIENRPFWTIVQILVVEGNPGFEEFKQRFQARIILAKNQKGKLLKPELQQYVVQKFGFLFWKWDREFFLGNHIRNTFDGFKYDTLNAETVHRIAQSITFNPFPPKRSPWEIIFLENYEDKEFHHNSNSKPLSVVIFRVHHALAGNFQLRLCIHIYFP